MVSVNPADRYLPHLHRMVLYDSAGVVVQHRPDPTLLVVSGSFALALAVLANLALTLRFVGTHTVR